MSETTITHSRWTAPQVELWKGVRAAVDAEPAKYNQNRLLEQNCNESCGCVSVACLGGWAHFLSGCRLPNDEEHDLLKCAAGRLGLSMPERCVVFSASAMSWPEPFYFRRELSGSRKAAENAMAYIDFILETGTVYR